jgi:hypothetical protein
VSTSRRVTSEKVRIVSLLLDGVTVGDLREFIAELDRLVVPDTEDIKRTAEPFEGLTLRVEFRVP